MARGPPCAYDSNMGTDRKANARYEAEFVRLLKGVNDRSNCLVGALHPGRMVRGHSVPASKLRLIAELRGVWKQVVTFDLGLDTLQGRAAGALPPVRAEPLPAVASIDSEGLTRPFACSEHDNQIFEPIDGAGFDPENPQHRTLVSYRALLWQLYEALWFARALRRMEATLEFRSMPIYVQQKERADRKQRQLEADYLQLFTAVLHREAVEKGGAAFTHRAIQLPGPPKVAFFGACSRGGTALWTAREREEAPLMTGGVREAVPFVLTCYPDPEGHVVVASCPSELGDLLPVVFPAFREAPDDREALLSASALDLVDQIMIAPSIWDGYGEERQRAIWDRYTRTPDGPRDALADIDIAPLNLFA